MEEMNEQRLDDLIKEALQRDALLADINRQVMGTLRRRRRGSTLRKWARLLAVCFGIPLAAVALVTIYYRLAERFAWELPISLAMLIATVSVMILAMRGVENFTPREV